MKSKQIALLVAAVITGIFGVFLLLHSLGWIEIPGLPFSVATAQGTIGMTVSTDFQRQTFLSAVSPGQTYKWKATASNTGTIGWDNAWITVRLSIPGASVVEKCAAEDPDVDFGCYLVEQCTYGKDNSNCREDIQNTWNLACTDYTIEWGTKLGSIVIGSVASGGSKSAEFTMTVPTDAATGTRYLITDLMVYAGGTYAVDGKSDEVDVGTVNGTLLLEFIGAVTLSILSLLMGVGAVVIK